MSRGPFDPLFHELPNAIPLFPLSGALLLPGGRLPLNIFEPRYLAMIQDAMATPHRMIGMIQPKTGADEGLYEIGCAGRISEFSESDDGRMMISLAGVTRFACQGSYLEDGGYLMGSVNFDGFERDLDIDNSLIERAKLIDILKSYFEVKGFSADWSHIEECEDERLVTTLSMICPLGDTEKQALLESADLGMRAQLLIAMLEMAVLSQNTSNQPRSGGGEAGNAPH